jgi:hypothetical protein
MAAVLAESELDTTCQILTTSPALTSSACVDGWLVYDTDCFSPAPWLSRGVRRPDFGSTMLQHRLANHRLRRVAPVGARSGEGPLSQSTAVP